MARLVALSVAGPTDLSFYLPRWHDVATLAGCRAAAVLLAHETRAHFDEHRELRVDDAVTGIARAAAWLEPIRTRLAHGLGAGLVDDSARIDTSASVGANVRIGAATEIGPGVVIESGAVIGHHVRIGAGALVAGAVSIGDRVRVGAGCVIGTDGFSFLPSGAGWLRVPGFGGVDVADDVELLARVVIHAGVFTDTVIESGCVLDTHVLIGHDARVGAGSALAAYAAVAGGARLGRACRIGGKAAIGEGVVLADDVTVGAMSAITASIERPVSRIRMLARPTTPAMVAPGRGTATPRTAAARWPRDGTLSADFVLVDRQESGRPAPPACRPAPMDTADIAE